MLFSAYRSLTFGQKRSVGEMRTTDLIINRRTEFGKVDVSSLSAPTKD